METAWWVLIWLCFSLSFIGLILPVLPAVGMIWLGIALFFFFLDGGAVSVITWGTLAVLTAVVLLADYAANALFVHGSGGSRLSIFASVVGAFLGLVFLPPFGIIIVPFFLVFLVETLIRHRPTETAMKIAFATLAAFLGSAAAKGFVQIIMIVVFLLDVL